MSRRLFAAAVAAGLSAACLTAPVAADPLEVYVTKELKKLRIVPAEGGLDRQTIRELGLALNDGDRRGREDNVRRILQ